MLVIDDDFRNVFALTALLERGRATVIVAESGQDALAILHRNPDIAVVLTDIMMPGMDGYETIQRDPRGAGIRKRAHPRAHGQGRPRRTTTVHRCRGRRLRRQTRGRSRPGRRHSSLRPPAAPGELGRAVSTAAEIEVAQTPPSPTQSVNILIVDDNAAKRLALKAVLHPLGHTLVEADSGIEALRCVLRQDFAMILLDVRMPIMDGFETAALIRKRPQSELTPIIFITAYGRDEIVRTDLYAEGAVDFIHAPVPPDELRSKVAAFASLYLKAEGLAVHERQVQPAADQLRLRNLELAHMARIDPLTGLGNRRAFAQDLEILKSNANRYARSFCLAMIDVDHFKAYNDVYGHQTGDALLQTLAGHFERHSRPGDSLYRFGGDEFLYVLPEQSIESGVRALRRIFATVHDIGLPHENSPTGIVTLTGGLAVLDATNADTSAAVLTEADQALYRGKQLGRNRIEPDVPLSK